MLAEEIIAIYIDKPNVTKTKMFGSDTLLINGNVFLSKMKEEIMFKLKLDDIPKALQIPDADYFDPMKNGKKMGNWIAFPLTISDKRLIEIARLSFEHISTFPLKVSKKKTAKKEVYSK